MQMSNKLYNLIVVKGIDNFLNRITMYRLALYYLMSLFAVAAILGAVGILPYSPTSLAISGLVVVFVCWTTNIVFAHAFRAQANIESFLITAFILVLIITPVDVKDMRFADVGFLVWASILAMASKYILAIGKKHVFNPVAISVVITSFAIGQSATWWVGGNLQMMPFVLAGGLLIVRKIRRFDLAAVFFVAAIISTVLTFLPRSTPLDSVENLLIYSPLLFFAAVMLTEPLTTPPTRPLRILYGALVGALFSPEIHLWSIYSTPELALVAGNVFSYIVSPKGKYILRLKEKNEIGADMYDFVFEAGGPAKFRPGQYMEWTLAHEYPDSRGNRRYFTIASAPTERETILGVKFYPAASTFKKALLSMNPGDEIAASQIAGDFVLPKDEKKKLVFMAGGIGITPFRSMIKYLLDKNERRELVLFYSNKTASEISYRGLFHKARKQLGIKTVYNLTDVESVYEDWKGYKGRLNAEIIAKEVPDYEERAFYLSGPRGMVTGFEEVLKKMGVKKSRIRTDFFPGFA